jgi:hypothetical protein
MSSEKFADGTMGLCDRSVRVRVPGRIRIGDGHTPDAPSRDLAWLGAIAGRVEE